MKLRKLSMLFAMFVLLSLTAAAQTSGQVVKVKPGEDSYKIKRGASSQVSVVIDIDDGYHINSNRPSEAFLIGTALKVERMRGLTTSAIIYPKAKVQKFSFSEKPMSVYEGKAVLNSLPAHCRRLRQQPHAQSKAHRCNLYNEAVCGLKHRREHPL